ncbi:hypothetical protein [Rubinisphaera sp. JC750]|uniref:hypothetical protein n=1 Tax=Rubinisphaera sp. JC750 TaxID=2898658 RepID=UPI001F37CC94|nr:hypothetical protein [Rubinisphaera sp. JC750]
MNDTYRLSEENPMTSTYDVKPVGPAITGQSSTADVTIHAGSEIAPVEKRSRRLRKYERLAGVDLFRGFLLLILGLGIGVLSVLELPHGDPVRQVFGYETARALTSQVTGSAWRNAAGPGLVYARDFLLSGFLFAAGVSLTLWRWKRRQNKNESAGHVRAIINRVGILILLGVFLQSVGSEQTRLVLTSPLAQIGLATLISSCFLTINYRWGWAMVAILLIGHAAWFYIVPVPEYGLELKTAGLETIRASHYLPPSFQQFAYQTNIADYTDRLWLSWLPGQPDAEYRIDGRVTWNFIPAAALMLTGVLVGRKLVRQDWQPLPLSLFLMLGGIGCIFCSLLFDASVAPAIERLMTISWVVLAAGYSLLLLGICLVLTESFGLKTLIQPLLTMGRHSLMAYVFLAFGSVWVSNEVIKHGQTVGSMMQLTPLPLTTCLLKIFLPVVITMALCGLWERRHSGLT